MTLTRDINCSTRAWNGASDRRRSGRTIENEKHVTRGRRRRGRRDTSAKYTRKSNGPCVRACVCVYRGGLFASPLPLNTGLLDAGTSCRNKCTAHKYAATICNQTVGSFSVSSKFLRLWNVYNPSVFDSCT